MKRTPENKARRHKQKVLKQQVKVAYKKYCKELILEDRIKQQEWTDEKRRVHNFHRERSYYD